MLTDREKAILDFEGERFLNSGARDQEIRARFDLTSIRYSQIVNALLDRSDALAYAPATVNRLRRLRSARAAVRGRRVRLG